MISETTDLKSLSLSVGDVRRAILGRGDTAAIAAAWHQALGVPPVDCAPLLELPLALPEAVALLRPLSRRLEAMATGWVEGREPGGAAEGDMDVVVVGVPPYGRSVGAFLERVMDEVKPDAIALDVAPIGLSAAMLYAFSLPCAVGLVARGEIQSRETRRFYTSETFYPGGTSEVAIVKAWLGRTPLLPVGVPHQPRHAELGTQHGYVDELHVDRELARSNVTASYRDLDGALGGTGSLEEGIKVIDAASDALLGTVGLKMRESLVEDGCYLASRIAEAAGGLGERRILAIVDLTRYADTRYALSLLAKGIRDETYMPPTSYALPRDLVMTSHHSQELSLKSEMVPDTTLAQALFREALEKLATARNAELLSEAEADRLIPAIAGGTRTHPDIAQGASVRGTIALREVTSGISEIEGGVTRGAIGRAALITLPPRIKAKQGASEAEVVTDIVKEALYGIRFSGQAGEVAAMDWRSSDEILKNLKNLRPLSPGEGQERPQRKVPAVVGELGRRASRPGQRLINPGQTLNKEALRRLLDQLDERFKAGEIGEAEYNLEKTRLLGRLKGNTEPRFRMSARELASTIMEFMDAQDKQWGSELSFERMHVYYHIQANAEGTELDSQKRDYYGLRMLIDDLGQQGIVQAAEAATNFSLTGQALDIVLDFLVDKEMRQSLDSAKGFGRTLVHERKHEVRKFSSGDIFRDISVRHTLKEVARQRKDLASVRHSDFRVFMKERRKQQADIVLCLDTSGSMGFHHKLMYARLAAIGVAKAALANDDRIGVVAFDNTTQTTVPITDRDKEGVIDYISRLYARGNTNIGDGIHCSSDLLTQGRSQNQKHILLITDGQPTAISQSTFDQLKKEGERDLTEESAILETRKAAAKGVHLSVIHIAAKNEPSGDFIRTLARAGKGKVRRISSLDDLRTILR